LQPVFLLTSSSTLRPIFDLFYSRLYLGILIVENQYKCKRLLEMSLTVNQVLMHFHKKHVRKEQLTEDGEMPVEIMIDRNRLNRSPVLDRVALDEAIVRLPRGYRIVFVLHDVEGLDHNEIASLLGCSIGTS
jgi:hypothetical protein